jgi:hypothetical protein
MNIGDLVRIRKTAIDHMSTLWFIDLADNKTPLVLVEKFDSVHPGWFVLRPDGSTFFILEENLTKRMW